MSTTFDVTCIKCGQKSEKLRCCFNCAVVSGVLRYDEAKKEYVVNLENTGLALQQVKEMALCENCESSEHIDHDSILISELKNGLEASVEKALLNSLSSIGGLNIANDVWRHMTRATKNSDVPQNGLALQRIYAEALRNEVPIFLADRKQTFSDPISIGSFNPIDDSWTSIGRMPCRKVNYGVASNKSSVFMFGGMRYAQSLRSVEVYDGEDNVSRTCNSMKHGRSRPFGCFHNKNLYVAGGYDKDYLKSVEIFSVESGDWSEAPSLKTARADAALVSCNNEVFVLGGFNGKTYENMIEKLNEQSQEFEAFASMEGARAGFGACEFRGRIYVAGGWDTAENTLRTVRSFGPNTKTWRDEPSMNKVRKYFTLYSTSEAIYAIKGYSSNWVSIKEVERFDPDQMKWTVITI